MGKLVGYILMLATIDLLFLLTGQLGLSSATSVILSAIISPSLITSSGWWITLISGTGGIGLLAAVGGIATGIVIKSENITFFSLMAGGLALLVGDFVLVFNHLASINLPLATIIMSPIILVLALTIVEWLRARD